jgi:hypothetical protein
MYSCALGSIGKYMLYHYNIFGQMQHRKIVAEDPKMVAIVLWLPLFLLNVVALVIAAIGECNRLHFSCDTQPLYCNSFGAFATHSKCCNKRNFSHYGCGNSINCNELGVASDTYCDTLVV